MQDKLVPLYNRFITCMWSFLLTFFLFMKWIGHFFIFKRILVIFYGWIFPGRLYIEPTNWVLSATLGTMSHILKIEKTNPGHLTWSTFGETFRDKIERKFSKFYLTVAFSIVSYSHLERKKNLQLHIFLDYSWEIRIFPQTPFLDLNLPYLY